jgi:hypothetical protein
MEVGFSSDARKVDLGRLLYANKTPDEMFASFVETMSRPEFKALVIELVSEFEKKFRRNPQDRILLDL